MTLASRNDRPDLDPVLVLEQLVFYHQIVAPNHQHAFRQEIQLLQYFPDAAGPFDLHFPERMVQQDFHYISASRRNAAASSGGIGLM